MRTLCLTLLLAGTASASAQTEPDGAPSPQETEGALAARADALRQSIQDPVARPRPAPVLGLSDLDCTAGVSMPRLGLDALPAPAPMPEAPLAGTPVPMPNVCLDQLASWEGTSGVFPITPDLLDSIDDLRDRLAPDADERLRESLDGVRERIERSLDASGPPVPTVPLAPPGERR